MDTFHQLQVLVLISLVILIAPAAVPPLRPHSRTLRLAALVIYLAGALAILVKWLLTPD
jgi:hypothetical protein